MRADGCLFASICFVGRLQSSRLFRACDFRRLSDARVYVFIAPQDASRIFISVSKVDAKTLFNAKNPILDRKDARIRRVPFMTQKPTFNETRRVAGRLAAVNLNVVEECAPPPAVVDEELTRLVDTKFIIAAKPKAVAEEPTAPPEEAEPEAPEPELHAAARAGDADRVLALLIDERADPTVVYRGKVAYVVSKDKDTRDAFRRAMARAPDAWEWISEAQVPSALTEELEAKHAAKEAEYEAARKAKEKERKKAQKERKKKQSAAAALLAKTPPAEERDEGGSKSAALLEKAGKDAKDRREQMVRVHAARIYIFSRPNIVYSLGSLAARTSDSSNKSKTFTNAGSRRRATNGSASRGETCEPRRTRRGPLS